MAKIGFIGLGNMGLPMAKNLLAAGHAITGFDLNHAALDALAEWAKEGPPHARVENVDVQDGEPEGSESFEVRR